MEGPFTAWPRWAIGVVYLVTHTQGAFSNKDSSIFLYNPGWIELNFQDISEAIYHVGIYFGVFSGEGAFGSYC